MTMDPPSGPVGEPSTASATTASASPRTDSPATPVTPTEDGDMIEIPSYGLEYWEYRRAAFLAGKPFPAPGSPATDLPESYTVPAPSPPAPSVLYCPPRGSSIERLEALLSTFGAEESDVAWNSGVGGVSRKSSGGKQLAKGLRLGLVIKILRAGWLRDGTWPLDPKTLRALPPPDSPPPAPGPDPYAPPPTGPAVATYTPHSHVFQSQQSKHSQQQWERRASGGPGAHSGHKPSTSSAVSGITGVSAPGTLESPRSGLLGLGNSPSPSPGGGAVSAERQSRPIPNRAGNE